MNSRRSRLFVTILTLMLSAAALQAAPTIVATPTSVALTYQLGTGTGTGPGAAVPVKIAPSAGSIYWTVNASTLPNWLVMDKSNGTATASSATTVNFVASPLAASQGAGTFTASVGIHSADAVDDITIKVTLTVKNAPAQLQATLTPIAPWKPGDTLPANVKLSVRSTGDPQAFTITSASTNPSTAWFSLASTTGTAYSTWSTDVNVSFSKSAFDNATVNKNLTGSITVKGTTNTVVVPVLIQVGMPANVTVSSILPAKLPKVASGTGTRTISVTGTGFADGMAVTLNTGITAIANACATFNAATTNAICIQSPTRFFLKLTEGTDLKSGSNIDLKIGGIKVFTIPVTTNPIVYSVSSSASFQVADSGNQVVAPYEIITIFGDNFMKVGDSVSGTIVNGRFPKKLTDQALDLSVHFTNAADVDLPADPDGYLLFATSSQINVIVPSTLPTADGGGELKAIVNYGPSASDPVTLDVAASHPGLFTYVTTGDAIAVNADLSVNSAAKPATIGAEGTVLTLYVTGLGNPNDGKSDPFVGSPFAPPDGCLNVDLLRIIYGWPTLDGGLIGVGQYNYAPCFDPARIKVNIGEKDFSGAAIAYAGWVAGSVVGLYQVNVTLGPGATTGMTAKAAGAYNAKVSVGGWSFDTAEPPNKTVTFGAFSPTATVYIK